MVRGNKAVFDKGDKSMEHEGRMNATGAIRRVDDLGRVVIPKEMRKYLNIKEGDALEVFKHDKYIIFTKYQNEEVEK